MWLTCNVALPLRVFNPHRQPTNQFAARGLRPQLAPTPSTRRTNLQSHGTSRPRVDTAPVSLVGMPAGHGRRPLLPTAHRGVAVTRKWISRCQAGHRSTGIRCSRHPNLWLSTVSFAEPPCTLPDPREYRRHRATDTFACGPSHDTHATPTRGDTAAADSAAKPKLALRSCTPVDSGALRRHCCRRRKHSPTL
jgi:hypothetical protein